MRDYRRSLATISNVESSIASFKHGDNFVILSHVADLNLEAFLTGEYTDFPTKRQLFTPASLLKEAAHLAGALHFIHSNLRLDDRTLSIAHLDVKPDNILIFWDAPETHGGVGRWKLHDFGISKVKSTYLNNYLGHKTTAHSTSIKEPRTYTAPEISHHDKTRIGTASDMWSFGCIIAVLVAFIQGGPHRVERFEQQRSGDDHGQRFHLDHFHREHGSKVELKPSVKDFLRRLLQSEEDTHDVEQTRKSGTQRFRTGFLRWESGQRGVETWTASIERLLKIMLDVDVEKRRKFSKGSKLMMAAVQETLDDLVRDHHRVLSQKASWQIETSRILEAGHISPPHSATSTRSFFPVSNTDTVVPFQYTSYITYPITPVDTTTTAELGSNSSDSRDDSASSQRVGRSVYTTYATVACPRSPIRAALCPQGISCATISEKELFVHNSDDVQNWAVGKMPKARPNGSHEALQIFPEFRVWDKLAIAGLFMVARSRATKTRSSESKYQVGQHDHRIDRESNIYVLAALFRTRTFFAEQVAGRS